MIGRTLSHYQVLEKIGEGGMGEVYLAKDTKLDREVAIKVLPPAFSENKERSARFEREAKLLASLNHPNIAAIHELEESEGVHFLALEYVPGETLAERIKRGAIPIDEALPLFKQIAEGLEAAHEKGVIHRDLKPANIKVTPEGKIKVLDFGLAKAMAGEELAADASQSPTLTKDTALGTILGTAAYMSPEQARGKQVDRRTDIWAFGCCLYEALSGKKAFEGETVTDTLSGVLRAEPRWELLPATTPQSTYKLLLRCLEKDPKKRLRDAGDAGLEIEEGSVDPTLASSPPTSARDRRSNPFLAITVAIAVAALGIAAWSILAIRSTGPSAVSHLSIQLSPPLVGSQWHSLALSPDGRNLVYVGEDETSKLVQSMGTVGKLYHRRFEERDARPIPGAENATSPIFAPDGRFLAFWSEGQIKKIPLEGGKPIPLCAAPNLRGASWGVDGFIYYSPDILEGIWKVRASGGNPERLTQPDPAQSERSHRGPDVLPDGKTLIFRISGGGGERLAALSLETGDMRAFGQGWNSARYAPSGHLIEIRRGLVNAAPFDAKIGTITGVLVPVIDDTQDRSAVGTNLSFSPNGTLAYISKSETKRSLVWVDRRGEMRPLGLPPGDYRGVHLSPDGKTTTIRFGIDIWIHDIERESMSRFTVQQGGAHCWSPDGKHIAFNSYRDKAVLNIYWKPINGSRDAELLLDSPYSDYPETWSPDGRTLLFRRQSQTDTGLDIWALPLENPGNPRTFIATPFDEAYSRFSPDGEWVAYQSTESGRDEVYVQPYPGPGGKSVVSIDGGSQPLWAADGKELFYRNGNQLLAVPVETKPELVIGRPRVLFDGRFRLDSLGISPDGQSFLMVEERPITHVNIVLNWFEELKRRVPTN